MNMAKTIKKQPVKKGRTYSVDKLEDNCLQLFNVTKSTFAGATYGLKGEYTIAELKEIIDKWLKEGV